MTLNSRRAWFTVARVFAKSMRAAALTAVFGAVLAADVAGQSQPPDVYQTYRAAVAMYAQTGDIARAVEPLQRWSGGEFDVAVKATMTARTPADLEAAAIFHLEIAVALVGVSASGAGGHISYGADLLDRWTATQPKFNLSAVDDQKQFRATWFAVAGSAFAAVKDIGRARPLLIKANGIVPRSARTQTLIGTLKEFEALQFNPDDAPTISIRERLRRERIIRLYQAELDYQEAIRYDANYALAHIRLGRVLHLSGKPREARTSLEHGQQLATEAMPKYLAALFMGALEQDEKHVDAARRSFEQAVAIAPHSQPAVVALAHLELMAGRPDRANALARSLAEPPSNAEPWWAFHNGGLDIGGVRSLRERATR
jgi:tetratricopeptide (TPR) repeat protein